MSNEAGLTDKERAILAGMAERVAADDPDLAAHLRGSDGRTDRLHLPEVPGFVTHWSCGVLCAAVGIVVMLVGLSLSIVVGVVGLLLTIVGIFLAISGYVRRLHAASDEAPPSIGGLR